MRFRVKTLSHLHIGDSEPWQKDFDYIYHEKSRTVFFIDHADFLEKLDIDFLKNTDDIETYRDKMLEMFKQRQLKILRQYSCAHTVSQVYPFIGDSLSPIIPGSSLKGAIRTAVLSRVINAQIAAGSTIQLSPEKYLEKQVGKKQDNIKMSMNALQIPDLPFETNKLVLSPFKTYSLSKHEFFEKENKVRITEALPPNIMLNHTLDIRLHYREKDKREFNGTTEIVDLPQTLREHYKRWIPREIAFLNKYSNKIDTVIGFYENLVKKIEEGSILLHLGFGTGWESKTGAFLVSNRIMWEHSILDFLKDIIHSNYLYKHPFYKVLNDMRYLMCPHNHYLLSISNKNNSNVFCPVCRSEYPIDGLIVNHPFPKSRKFVLYNNSLLPPGWIELIPTEADK